MNLLEFFEDVTGRVDRGEPVDVAYLDFQEAFTRSHITNNYVKLKHMGLEVMS